MNLRSLCFNILKQVEGGSFVQNELKDLSGLDGRDAALVTKIVKGVVRNRIRLERKIASASSRPLSNLDGDTLLFLLIGVYQLTEMDGIPSYAAVNETVNAMKKRRMHKTAGFVNGVLRTIAKNKHETETYESESERLSVEYSFPLWLVERWGKNYTPLHLEELLKAMNSEPQTSIFVNEKKITPANLSAELSAEGIRCERNKYFDDMLIVEEGRAADTGAFKKGSFYIQDPASRLVSKVASLLSDKTGSAILDVAAAPGGKSINLLCDGYNVVSSDISPAKLNIMKDNLIRMELDSNLLAALDAEKPLPFARPFKIILLDAPCSACGRVRRAPEIKYRLAPDDFEFLASQQSKILSNLSGWVEDGGYLVYATCSIDRSEDEDVIEGFLGAHPEFVLADPRSFSRQLPLLNEITDGKGFIRTDALIGEMDGFFIAVLKKMADGGSLSV